MKIGAGECESLFGWLLWQLAVILEDVLLRKCGFGRQVFDCVWLTGAPLLKSCFVNDISALKGGTYDSAVDKKLRCLCGCQFLGICDVDHCLVCNEVTKSAFSEGSLWSETASEMNEVLPRIKYLPIVCAAVHSVNSSSFQKYIFEQMTSTRAKPKHRKRMTRLIVQRGPGKHHRQIASHLISSH